MNVKVEFHCGHTRTIRNITEENVRERLGPLFLTRYGECIECHRPVKIYRTYIVRRAGEYHAYNTSYFVERMARFTEAGAEGEAAIYTFSHCGHEVRGFLPPRATRSFMGKELFGECPLCGDDSAYTITRLVFPRPVRLSGYGFEPDEFVLTLGCDPEFEIPGVSEVSDFLRDRGCDGDLLKDAIGVDGAGEQVELRPAPSANPTEVIDNIRALLTEFAQRIGSDLDPRGENAACGGHIHIGVSVRGRFPSIVDTRAAVRALDAFIGVPSLALNGYARGHYAELSNMEFKTYGFEYRTPPAAIFADCDVLAQVFDIARRVMERTLTKGFTYLTNANGSATLDSYNRLLGYVPTLFLDMCASGAEEVTDSLMAAWKVEIPAARRQREPLSAPYVIRDALIEFACGLVVTTNDTWDYAAKKVFAVAISEYLEEEFIASCGNAHFEMFGLSAERGAVVSGLRVDAPIGFETLVRYDSGWIGIPAECRYNLFDYYRTGRVADAVARHIIITLKERGNVCYRDL